MRRRFFPPAVLLIAAVIIGVHALFSPFISRGMHSSLLEGRSTELSNGERFDYIDENGAITFAYDRFFASFFRTMDENDHILWIRYFDADGNPVRLKSGYCTISQEYNELGQCVRITYLDKRDNPVDISSGYAVINRSFNANGQLERQYYLNAQGAPAADRTGTCGYCREYNDAGQLVTIVYLDGSGNPMKTNSGYAILRRTFSADGSYSEFYYDHNNLPVKASSGCYGITYIFDDSGHVVKQIHLGIDGKPAATPRGYSIVQTTYSAQGRKLANYYLDSDGNPAEVLGRYHSVSYENGQEIYRDKNGRVVFLLDVFLHNHLAVVVCIGLALCIAAILLPAPLRVVLMALYVLFIGYMTLMFRETQEPHSRLRLFWSYRQFLEDDFLRRSILNNIFLFIPLGALLRSLADRRQWLWLIPLLSAAVELTQYFTGLGLCELDDIVSNTLGGLLGYAAVWLVSKQRTKPQV